ncbi:hypothetical protein [Serratia fonticola]
MLTFKHFCDRPSWAAAAGYDFNIIDCISAAAVGVNIKGGLGDIIADIPYIELREAWWRLPLSLILIAGFITWPLTFWLVGLASYFKCRRSRKEYRDPKSEIVQANLRNWLNDFDRRQRKSGR